MKSRSFASRITRPTKARGIWVCWRRISKGWALRGLTSISVLENLRAGLTSAIGGMLPPMAKTKTTRSFLINLKRRKRPTIATRRTTYMRLLLIGALQSMAWTKASLFARSFPVVIISTINTRMIALWSTILHFLFLLRFLRFTAKRVFASSCSPLRSRYSPAEIWI